MIHKFLLIPPASVLIIFRQNSSLHVSSPQERVRLGFAILRFLPPGKPIPKDKGVRWVVLNHFLHVKIEVRMERDKEGSLQHPSNTHTHLPEQLLQHFRGLNLCFKLSIRGWDRNKQLAQATRCAIKFSAVT